MRFRRWPRHEYEWTARKAAAVVRRQRREAESAPLFADEIRSLQPTVDEVHALRVRQAAATEVEYRRARADAWRQARQKLWRLPTEERAAVRAFWDAHRWFPGDPFYFAYVLDRHVSSAAEAA